MRYQLFARGRRIYDAKYATSYACGSKVHATRFLGSHRRTYSRADAQAVVDWLNERDTMNADPRWR